MEQLHKVLLTIAFDHIKRSSSGEFRKNCRHGLFLFSVGVKLILLKGFIVGGCFVLSVSC